LPLSVRPETLYWITKLSWHKANGSETQECERLAIEVVPVLGEPSTAIEPCNGGLDDPALRDDLEASLSSFIPPTAVAACPAARRGRRPGIKSCIGASPSGKAADFDSAMRRFESSRPSQPVLSPGFYFPVGENRRHFRGLGGRARHDSRQRRFDARFRVRPS
jgi:hypothetical protein